MIKRYSNIKIEYWRSWGILVIKSVSILKNNTTKAKLIIPFTPQSKCILLAFKSYNVKLRNNQQDFHYHLNLLIRIFMNVVSLFRRNFILVDIKGTTKKNKKKNKSIKSYTYSNSIRIRTRIRIIGDKKYVKYHIFHITAIVSYPQITCI